MSDPMCRIWLLLLLGGFTAPGVHYVRGITIYAAEVVEAVNGTDVKLKCTFTSSHPISLKSVAVSWNFRPLHSGLEESVFYYQEAPYPPQNGRFKGHAIWSGDIMKGDASITLQEVPPSFNGTYICQVRNRPDVHGSNGETVLKVVDKAGISEIGILAAAIGGACGIILVLLGIFVSVRYCKGKNKDDIELQSREQEWKDPTVCSPEEAAHLYVAAKVIEVDSSDGDESEESSGGDDEEEEGEGDEDDDDDDDDDDDGDDDDD